VAKAAGPAAGLGVGAALGLLLVAEAGVVLPFPADLLMLFVGERAAAGSVPLWLAVAAFALVSAAGTTTLFLLARGPGQAVLARLGPRVGLGPERLARASAVLDRRGRPALAIGRGTPGLRTMTVVVAATSKLPVRSALPLLVLGSTVFLEAHLLLGYLLGPAATDLLEHVHLPAVLLLVLLALAGFALWRWRRGRRSGTQSWAEASCPACLAVAALAGTLERPAPVSPEDPVATP
jgi:membrane protein DedA with SNARE-associated domain